MLGLNKRAKVQQIDGDTLNEFMKDKTVRRQYIDVRTPQEFKSGKVKGFKNIPVQDLKQRIKELKEDEPVVLICATGSRSFFAGRVLAKAGFTSIYNVQRGLAAVK